MIKYKVVNRTSAMSEADLDAEYRMGYELISCLGLDKSPDEFVYYFKYVGGIKNVRAIGGTS